MGGPVPSIQINRRREMKKKNLLGVCALLVMVGGLALSACAPEKIVETVIVTEVIEVAGEDVEVTRVVEVEVTPEPEVESWEEWESIKVGVPTAITGPGAPMGQDIMAGMRMAVETINAEGGVLGKPVDVLYADTKISSAEDCTVAADLMDRSGVVAFFPGAFYGVGGVHAFGRFPQILFHTTAQLSCTEAVMENMEEYRNIFQMCGSEAVYGENGYEVILDFGHFNALSQTRLGTCGLPPYRCMNAK